VGTGFLSIYDGPEVDVEGLLIAYEGGGPSTLKRGGDWFLFPSGPQLSPSALAMEVEKVSSVGGL